MLSPKQREALARKAARAVECEGGWIVEGAKAMTRLVSVVSLLFAIALLAAAAYGWYEGAQFEREGTLDLAYPNRSNYLGESLYRKYTVEAEIVAGAVFLMIGVACWGGKPAKAGR